MDTQGSQQQKIAEECARIAQELAKEQKVPRGLSTLAYDLLCSAKGVSGGPPTKDEVVSFLEMACNTQFVRWYLRRLSMTQREKLLKGPASRVEAQMETLVNATLEKGSRVSVKKVAKMAEFYLKIPIGIATPIARKVIHRVRQRRRIFLNKGNIEKAFKRFAIPEADFLDLAKAGVINHATSGEALRVAGNILQRHYHVTKRLKMD